MTPITTWRELVGKLDYKASLLLGNGFSIACDLAFRYDNLLEEAVRYGLSASSMAVFEMLETANFEQVLLALDRASSIAEMYGCDAPCPSVPSIRDDLDETKRALVAASTAVHGSFPDQHKLPEDFKRACIKFLKPFYTVYSLNYDFLLYWVWMKGLESADPSNWRGDWKGFGDGFQSKEHNYVKVKDGGVRFLHGALHLYIQDGKTYKYVSEDRVPLLAQVTEGILSDRYPMFIAEGSSKKKLVGIHSNDYLHDCFSEFSSAGPDLVTFGVSFGDSDAHLIEAICRNRKLRSLYIGSHGEPSSQLLAVVEHIRKEHPKLTKQRLDVVQVFRTDTTSPWK